MSWDYAELSKLASQNGGPEELLEKIKLESVREGQLSMLPYVLATLVAGTVAGAVAGAVGNHLYEGKAKKRREEVDEAEKELIQGIQAYDATHQENEKPDMPA